MSDDADLYKFLCLWSCSGTIHCSWVFQHGVGHSPNVIVLISSSNIVKFHKLNLFLFLLLKIKIEIPDLCNCQLLLILIIYQSFIYFISQYQWTHVILLFWRKKKNMWRRDISIFISNLPNFSLLYCLLWLKMSNFDYFFYSLFLIYTL